MEECCAICDTILHDRPQCPECGWPDIRRCDPAAEDWAKPSKLCPYWPHCGCELEGGQDEQVDRSQADHD